MGEERDTKERKGGGGMEYGEGERLYRQYLEGDEASLDGVILRYKDGLIRFLHYLVRDWHTAEDLSEDCFVELIVHPRRYRFQSSLKTYLYAVARHKAMSHLRRRTALPLLSLDALSGGEEADGPAFSEAAGRERREALLGALKSLPRDYGTVLYLRYFEGLSSEEISRVMKKSLKQVYNLSSRAKNALKTRLEKDEWPYETAF